MTVAPRVGLVGLLGQGNLGNDGSLEAVLAYLDAEHPDAILDFLCTGTDQMMEEVGLVEFCQSAHSVDVDRLIEQFTELESRSTQLQQMIMERTAANVRLLNHQFVTLSALLFRSAEPEDAAAGHEHTRTDPFLGEVL